MCLRKCIAEAKFVMQGKYFWYRNMSKVYFIILYITYITIYYTPCPEKNVTLFSTITLAFLRGFLQIVYHWKHE